MKVIFPILSPELQFLFWSTDAMQCQYANFSNFISYKRGQQQYSKV